MSTAYWTKWYYSFAGWHQWIKKDMANRCFRMLPVQKYMRGSNKQKSCHIYINKIIIIYLTPFAIWYGCSSITSYTIYRARPTSSLSFRRLFKLFLLMLQHRQCRLDWCPILGKLSSVWLEKWYSATNPDFLLMLSVWLSHVCTCREVSGSILHMLMRSTLLCLLEWHFRKLFSVTTDHFYSCCILMANRYVGGILRPVDRSILSIHFYLGAPYQKENSRPHTGWL